jgi:hypothetical protein
LDTADREQLHRLAPDILEVLLQYKAPYLLLLLVVAVVALLLDNLLATTMDALEVLVEVVDVGIKTTTLVALVVDKLLVRLLTREALGHLDVALVVDPIGT